MATEHDLHSNMPLRLEHAGAGVIECIEGRAWVTAYAEFADTVLQAGQRYTIPNHGLVLVEAVGSGRIRVHAAAPRRAWWALHIPTLLSTRTT
ncbi:DUF2917 domain-containing protein [Janthinobacterium sp. PC23-8]|uniref:DUF2917 domain-containing protein n=1 Tax=Janthinobacterium sp. PC23-8 TaxID=2012679 RepID=UPI0015961AC7|nr:DUF2917 domain-containing protein [Janthinobacterium sp. PC23-8]